MARRCATRAATRTTASTRRSTRRDARAPGVPDITDDELDAALAKLDVASAVIVLDSCHSGTALRGASDVTERIVPMDTREDLYKPMTTRGAVVPLPVSERYVLYTGAAAHQSALDGPFAEGRFHGLFTFAFARTLNASPPSATPVEVMRGVERELAQVRERLGGRELPEPQLEAPQSALDAAFLAPIGASAAPSAPAVARLAWAEVRKGDGGATLVDAAGLGAAAESIWAVYDAGETRFAPGAALARLVVKSVRGRDAWAVPVAGDRVPASGGRAVLVAPPPPPELTHLALRAVPEPIRRTLGARLAALPDSSYMVVEDGQAAAYTLDCAPRAGGIDCSVFGPLSDQPVAQLPTTAKALAADLDVALTRTRNVASLATLENPGSAMQLDLQVVGQGSARAAPTGERGLVVVSQLGLPGLRFYQAGETRTPQNSLQLEIRTSADCYLTLVDIDSEGGVTVLFPNAYQKPDFYPGGRIAANESVLIPDSLAPANALGFHFDYGPPAGLDTIRAFCNTELADAQALRDSMGRCGRQRGRRDRGARGSRPSFDGEHARHQRLRGAGRTRRAGGGRGGPGARCRALGRRGRAGDFCRRRRLDCGIDHAGDRRELTRRRDDHGCENPDPKWKPKPERCAVARPAPAR